MGLTLVSRKDTLASSREQMNLLAAAKTCPPFEEKLATAGLQPLHATGITVFQINVGKFCNQTCRHCHVDAGPERPSSIPTSAGWSSRRAGWGVTSWIAATSPSCC
jgi:hypothetical protein